ncbi:MAG: sugar phosphate isomerase/epimerase [Bacilli bacterium]|nr:sugar phosphate isomerase/epimerase [Bacilli bacterium]
MNHFRLGIITDEVSQDINEVINFAQKFSLETLELRSLYDKPLHQLDNATIQEIKSLISKSGLSICALSAPIFKCELDDPKQLQRHVELVERYIDIATELNVKLIRGFSFWAKTAFEQALPTITEQIKNIVPYFEKSGITFALEFDPSVYASNARKVSVILDAVQSPFVKALYDPGNDVWDPDEEVPYPDGYEYLKGKICHIHLKDALKVGTEVEAVAIGSGQVNYHGLFRKLIEDRYEGYVIVETHYRLKSKLTELQLKSPKGQSFSQGGWEASEDCVNNLKNLLKDLV